MLSFGYTPEQVKPKIDELKEQLQEPLFQTISASIYKDTFTMQGNALIECKAISLLFYFEESNLVVFQRSSIPSESQCNNHKTKQYNGSGPYLDIFSFAPFLVAYETQN